MKVCLLLLLSVSSLLVNNSEAGIGDWIRGAVNWGRNTCRSYWCRLLRGKREASLLIELTRPFADGAVSGVRGERPGSGNALHGDEPFNCSSSSLRLRMVPKLALDVAFIEIDTDEDGQLNDVEFALYQGIVQIIADCINDVKAV